MDNLLTGMEMTQQQALDLIALGKDLKANPSKYAQSLAGKSVVTLFEKQSLRTRVTFDIGVNKLGGHAVYLDQTNGAMGSREDVKDFAANISRWADCIVARVFDHNTLLEMEEFASVPVINSLCDLYHPCQGMADFLTISQNYDDLSQVKLAYIGDGNNVTHSLFIAGAILGATVTAVCPLGHSPDAQIMKKAEEIAKQTGATISVTNNIDDIQGYDVVYGDTWLSMGDDTPLEQIKAKFMPYQINQALLDHTGIKHVLHCQPAHRGLDITSDVMDGPASLIFDQAENRMHIQNAIMLTLINKQK
ncbi:ornithine carbamoyltransferase [Psychromonas sp. 14N.309.X.WAT.B.A12]|uniref:ornithine carbamoyltransferase n=1 Tax=unclassified Psychromonas TaxID=2614957 RepID=UPI0025B0DD36|nr:ornithine carbamoyltransferase [Psychromonas sp. 14N.309.X.WAT.B.A12]MDN2665036.1 ornithine carbamoyltransferase [Psychromonas sp. 14N.309.X.WAT.B.A12]